MRSLLLVLLTTLSFTSAAEWTQMSENIDSDKYYVDLETRKCNANNCMVRLLINYKEKTNLGTMSKCVKVIFNCDNETMQTLKVSFFTKPFAEGSASSFINNMGFTHIAPGTAMRSMMRAVCK